MLKTTVSPAFLIASSVLALAIIYLQPKPPSDRASSNSYSPLDQTLHQIAFNTYTAQITLVKLEDRLCSRQLANCKDERPVFITALPRAGTTL